MNDLAEPLTSNQNSSNKFIVRLSHSRYDFGTRGGGPAYMPSRAVLHEDGGFKYLTFFVARRGQWFSAFYER